jgi:hypothetical protein
MSTGLSLLALLCGKGARTKGAQTGRFIPGAEFASIKLCLSVIRFKLRHHLFLNIPGEVPLEKITRKVFMSYICVVDYVFNYIL